MEESNLCKHIAIIMDGNGRWAKKRAMPRSFGHKKGAENVVKITRAMKESGVKFLTLYAFSTENWQRSKDEVDALMDLLREYLDKEFQEIMENNVNIIFIGEREMLSEDIQKKIDFLEKESAKNTDSVLHYAKAQRFLLLVPTAKYEQTNPAHHHMLLHYLQHICKRLTFRHPSFGNFRNHNSLIKNDITYYNPLFLPVFLS